MSIDLKEAARIAALAHLEFDDAALQRMSGELSRILDYIDQLREVDLGAIDVSTQLATTPMADDVVAPSLPLSDVERNAPSFVHGHFVVPKVIGGES